MTTRNSLMPCTRQCRWKREKPQEAIQQFAVDYYDIDAYKAEILTAEPGLNSDTAYEKALLRAADEVRELSVCFFRTGITGWRIAWDSDAGEGRMVM